MRTIFTYNNRKQNDGSELGERRQRSHAMFQLVLISIQNVRILFRFIVSFAGDLRFDL